MANFEVTVAGKSYHVSAPDAQTAAKAATQYASAPATRARADAERTVGRLDQRAAGRTGSAAAGRLDEDRSRSAAQGYSFGVSDELQSALPAVRTAVANAFGRGPGYTAKDAYDARMGVEAQRLNAFRQEHPVQSALNEMGGGLANPVNALGGEFIAGARGTAAVGRAALVGGATGAAYGAGSAQQGQRLQGALAGGAVGAGTGGVLQAAGNAVARSATRAATQAAPARQLARQGVQLTPGQRAGGALRRMEDGATSIPITGDIIRNAQRRSIESFDRVAVNRALAPIGQTLPNNVDIGREGVREATARISQAYEGALQGVTIAPDQQLAQDLNAALQTPNLTQNAQATLTAIVGDLRTRLASSPNGPANAIDGRAWKQIDSELSAAIRSADNASGTDPAQRLLREALTRTRAAWTGVMERGNPQALAAVRQADEATANLARIRDASQGTATAAREGAFTPADLNRAVRNGDSSAGNRAYAQGDALMQDLTDPAMQVLPQTVPDSGTVFRSVMTGNLAGLGLGAVTAGPTAIAYSRPVQAVLNQIYAAGNPGQARAALAQLQQLAARSPGLQPLYQELAGKLGVQPLQHGDQQGTPQPQQ